MSTSINNVGEWVLTQLKRVKACEMHYGDYAISEQEQKGLNEWAKKEGLEAYWRKEGGSDVVRYVKAPAPPQSIKLSGGPFGNCEFVSPIVIPKDIVILGHGANWEEYTCNDGESYVHGTTNTAIKPGFVKMTPIRRGNQVIRLEPFQEDDR